MSRSCSYCFSVGHTCNNCNHETLFHNFKMILYYYLHFSSSYNLHDFAKYIEFENKLDIKFKSNNRKGCLVTSKRFTPCHSLTRKRDVIYHFWDYFNAFPRTALNDMHLRLEHVNANENDISILEDYNSLTRPQIENKRNEYANIMSNRAHQILQEQRLQHARRQLRIQQELAIGRDLIARQKYNIICHNVEMTDIDLKNEKCAVCYEEYMNTEFINLNCTHSFCSTCTITCIQQNTMKYFNCPLCRALANSLTIHSLTTLIKIVNEEKNSIQFIHQLN